MDNLRSLNSSLPAPSSSRRQRSSHDNQAQQQLLQAFKTAALSVTNLYRAAAAENPSSSYSDGYKDALEDLVDFLDREELGLNDGEGWRVRQWAAERLDNPPAAAAGVQNEGSDDEEAEAEEEKRARSSSPAVPSKPEHRERAASPASTVRNASPTRSGSAPPSQQQSQRQSPAIQFTFHATHPYPKDVDMAVDGQLSQQTIPTQRTPRFRNGTLRPNTQSHNRSSLAGSKRKNPYIDFFDFTGAGNDKSGQSGGGAGKRNRIA